jgi:hypothetical protein
MTQSRKEQLNIPGAYWTKITYTATGDTASTTISEATINTKSITQSHIGNASSTPPVRGVITLGSDNIVRIRNANTALPFSASGSIIYGRITYSGSNYIVTYYQILSGIETAVNIPGSGSLSVEMLFPEVMNYSEVPAGASIIDEGGFVGGGGGASTAFPLHDTTHAPVGLWQLQNDLLDTSGNNFTLSTELLGVSGKEAYGPMYPNLFGIASHSSLNWKIYRNATDSALRLTGDMTIECFLLIHEDQIFSDNTNIIGHGDLSGSSSVNNYLYRISLTSTGAFNKGVTWTQQSGSGVDSTYAPTDFKITAGNLVHFAATRTSNVIQFYLNGLPAGAASTALTTPTGGTAGKLHVLSSSSSVSNKPSNATISSLKIIPTALSAAQIKAEYNRTFGKAFGIIT